MIDLAFGPGEIHFRLPMARIIEIERLCGDKSIATMHDEMSGGIGLKQDGAAVFLGGGGVRIKDVYETIRCAAIGGGMAPIEAKQLVDEYVDGRPYAETVPVAWAILNAALLDVGLKKKEPEPQEGPDLTDAVK